MLANALKRIRAEREAEDRGFTLIELLVVVVIIGILVAIAIPLYLSYRKGAENKATASDVRNAVPALEQFYSDNNVYPATGTQAGGAGTTVTFTGTGSPAPTTTANVSSGTIMKYKALSGGYAICAQNNDTSQWYVYNSTTGGSVATAADGSLCT